jgi:hypothetical protein
MLCAFARSTIDAMLFSIISNVDGPVFPAISFVPARNKLPLLDED